MKGYKVGFNVFAQSQEEADAVSQAFGRFVNECAGQGIAVSADKLLAVISKWGTNPMVKNFFR